MQRDTADDRLRVFDRVLRIAHRSLVVSQAALAGGGALGGGASSIAPALASAGAVCRSDCCARRRFCDGAASTVASRASG